MTSADEINPLLAEAEHHWQVARRIIAMREHDRVLIKARLVLAADDPVDQIREQIDSVAYRMILRADALRAAMTPSDEAVVIYENVVRLFPTTPSADSRVHPLTNTHSRRKRTCSAGSRRL